MSDVERSVAWYRDKLGFEVVEEDPGIVLLRVDSGFVYLFEESPPTEDKPSEHLVPKPGGVIIVLMVEDCRALYERLADRGVEFLTPPKSPSWGGWRCFARDPDETDQDSVEGWWSVRKEAADAIEQIRKFPSDLVEDRRGQS